LKERRLTLGNLFLSKNVAEIQLLTNHFLNILRHAYYYAEMASENPDVCCYIECFISAGYTALHRAAAWGKIEALKPLVEADADLQLKTDSGERAREVALRYNQTECVDYLDWAGKV
jgi:hypothetical protein